MQERDALTENQSPTPARAFSRRVTPKTALCALLCGIMGPLSGCADLSVLDSNVCGNNVLEPDIGEDCDGEADCGVAGTPTACRILCSSEDEIPCGGRLSYGCGVDGICRKSNGEYELLSASSTSTLLDVFAGDINADGCNEVVITRRQDVELTAFASQKPGLCPELSQVLPYGKTPDMRLSRPAPLFAGLISERGRKDLLRPGDALYEDALFIHAAGPTPQLTPALYPITEAMEEAARVQRISYLGSDALLLLLDKPGEGDGPPTVGLAGVIDPTKLPLMLNGALESPLSELSILKVADIIDDMSCDNCDEILAGFMGTSTIHVVKLTSQSGTMAVSPFKGVITLPPGITIRKNNAALATLDLNGDGFMDVVVNGDDGNMEETDNHLYAAYGTGAGKFHSDPTLPVPSDTDEKASILMGYPPEMATKDFIFVAGKFTDQGPPTLIPVACPPSTVNKSSACLPIPGGCEAVVDDIDKDGLDDIISSQEQQPGLIVQRSANGSGFYTSFVSTLCPPHHLATGDFDNDGVKDVAFFDQVQEGLGTQDVETPVTTLMVSYGNAYSGPDEPLVSGRFAEAQGLTSGSFSSNASTTQLYAARKFPPPEPEPGADPEMTPPGTSGFALVEGYGERQLFAPFYLPPQLGGPPTPGVSPSLSTVEITAAVSLRLGIAPTDDGLQPVGGVAMLTLDKDIGTAGGKDETEKLWLFESRNDGDRLLSNLYEGTGPIPCSSCVLVAVDLLPKGKVKDGVDELIILSNMEPVMYSVTTVTDPDTGDRHVFEEVKGFTINTDAQTAGVAFSAFDRGAENGPEKYSPRPLVADLDGDEISDVLLRADSGALIVLWGREDGSVDATELVPASACVRDCLQDKCDEASCLPEQCSGKCSATFTDIDGDGISELLVAAPDCVARLNIDPETRKLVSGQAFKGSTCNFGLTLDPGNGSFIDVIPPKDTDYTAISSADVDGDGVTDIILAPSSSQIATLRGDPEIE